MEILFYKKNRFKKMIVYASAAMLFTTVPILPAHAAENTQTSDSSAEIPPQQESQPASDTTPAEIPDSNPSDTDNVPSQDTPALEVPTSPSSTEAADATDATTTAPPAPAAPGSVEVTPMQSTVYAAAPKGLNVRSGPSTNHSKLGTLQYGQAVTVTGITADNWYQIQYSGSVGYVLADYVSNTPLTAESPASPNPPAENPDPPNTDVDISDTETVPDNFLGDEEDEDDDFLAEEDSYEGSPAVTSSLLGTPVIIVLAVAIVGVMAMIGYSVYSLFKKDDDATDEYYEDDYYEEDPDGEYYEDDQYSDGEYYEDDQYSDEEYYEDNPYSDDEYYGDSQYSDEEYYEDSQYSDEEYYEDNQYSDEEYYEDNDKKQR